MGIVKRISRLGRQTTDGRWSDWGVFELRADRKARSEQATEGLRWHEFPKQGGEVHWLWDGASGKAWEKGVE